MSILLLGFHYQKPHLRFTPWARYGTTIIIGNSSKRMTQLQEDCNCENCRALQQLGVHSTGMVDWIAICKECYGQV